jgi:hypothetical protein
VENRLAQVEASILSYISSGLAEQSHSLTSLFTAGRKIEIFLDFMDVGYVYTSTVVHHIYV